MEKARVQTNEGTVEARIARLEGILDQMDKRLSEFREDLTRRMDRLDARFWWLLGIQISMWITIILAILFGK